MKFDMRKPCGNCPFRKGKCAIRLSADRVSEIMQDQGTFPCHKSVDYSDDGEGTTSPDSRACVGKLVLMDKMGQPNQMMRIAGRLGLLQIEAIDDPKVRKMVVDNPSEIIEERTRKT